MFKIKYPVAPNVAALCLFFVNSAAAQANGAGGGVVKEVAATHVETARELLRIVVSFAVQYGFQVLGGVMVLLAGWLVAKYIARYSDTFLARKHIDVTVRKFFVGGVKLAIIAFAVIVALGKFGIEIAPLIAGISVVGFGTSFALQGPLSNYASGVTLIFTKPFKVGEIIEVAGVVGEVTDMKLSRTEIKTVDGTMIVVPNRHIIGEVIQNFSCFKRLDITVGISYHSDVDKAIAVVEELIKADARVTKEKRLQLGILEFADSSVNLMARVWCRQDDYYDLLFGLNRQIFKAFKERGIEIPFPQRDVHIISTVAR